MGKAESCFHHERRDFLRWAIGTGAAAAAAPEFLFAHEVSKLRITDVRVVRTRPHKPLPTYKVPQEEYSRRLPIAVPVSQYFYHSGTTQVVDEKQRPPRIDIEHDPNVPMFPLGPDPLTVEVVTDKGIRGLGRGGGGGKFHVPELAKFVVGEDPFDVAKLWDLMYLGTLAFGRAGAVIHAISAIDLAIWDVVGKALEMPVYKLIGGQTKPRIPAYATLNDVQWKKQVGFRKIKLAMPYGPINGREGFKQNVALVKYAREEMGPDVEIMLDCWMSMTEPYALELADALAPYRVNWIEEPLAATDYEGHARLREKIKTCRIATGEHLFTRYEFLKLGQAGGADVWQPDIHWSGGLTELLRIAAMAMAFNVQLLPHLGGSSFYASHLIMATPASPWAEFFWPPEGGPDEVYRSWEEQYRITRGPEGVYTLPLDVPGFGWDVMAEPAN
jgi:L-rhamnonate dehydratase